MTCLSLHFLLLVTEGPSLAAAASTFNVAFSSAMLATVEQLIEVPWNQALNQLSIAFSSDYLLSPSPPSQWPRRGSRSA